MGGEDEILDGQAPYLVCTQCNVAPIVAKADIGMMILTLCQPDDSIHKGGGLGIVLEIQGFFDAVLRVVELPLLELCQ